MVSALDTDPDEVPAVVLQSFRQNLSDLLAERYPALLEQNCGDEHQGVESGYGAVHYADEAIEQQVDLAAPDGDRELPLAGDPRHVAGSGAEAGVGGIHLHVELDSKCRD